jgi:hypothetical protein
MAEWLPGEKLITDQGTGELSIEDLFINEESRAQSRQTTFLTQAASPQSQKPLINDFMMSSVPETAVHDMTRHVRPIGNEVEQNSTKRKGKRERRKDKREGKMKKARNIHHLHASIITSP